MSAAKPPLPEWVRLLLLSPAEAVKWMQDRGLLAPTFSWQDLWQDEHSRMFTVAKMMRLDLLQVVYDAVSDAVEKGAPLRDFSKALTPILQEAGWWGKQTVVDPLTGEEVVAQLGSPKRLELIYDVNLRQSYAAGRFQRAQRSRAAVPFLLYRTMRDERVRATHRPWDNIALPVDHAWWDTHYPPNGWRCRCRARPATQSDLDELRDGGMEIKTEAPPIEYVEFTNRRTGAVERVPRGIDPGFAFNPGKVAASEKALDAAYQQKLAGIAEALRQAQERLDRG